LPVSPTVDGKMLMVASKTSRVIPLFELTRT
jgi:hypothetical protein